MKMIIEITGADVELLEADEVANVVFDLLDDNEFDVSVTGYTDD